MRLCAKIVAEHDIYETDKEKQNLIDWYALSEADQKKNNNTIRNLTGNIKEDRAGLLGAGTVETYERTLQRAQ